MRFANLQQWLSWQETLHPKKIDLGLDRVHEVADRLRLSAPRFPVVTVAGTNGKGSCVALLEAIYTAGGYSVGCYTSPHLLRYNERVRLGGAEASDAELCEAFARVDQARRDTTLTYFEFGTLAALDIFFRREPDLVILETGLGGRLDAVNILDADVALVSNVAIDHAEWLGADREAIGAEKAGIFRNNQPAICADPAPPASLRMGAETTGAIWLPRGRAFDFEEGGGGWSWYSGSTRLDDLPLPALRGPDQLANAAGALMVVKVLGERLPLVPAAIAAGLVSVRLPGRRQIVRESPQVILDVAHNPGAATALADSLRATPVKGRTLAVIGMLATKDVAGTVAALDDEVDAWYPAGLAVPQGLDAEALVSRLSAVVGDKPVMLSESVEQAWDEVTQAAAADDRIVVCGSFSTVAAVLRGIL